MSQDRDAQNGSQVAFLEQPPVSTNMSSSRKRNTEPILTLRSRVEDVLAEHGPDVVATGSSLHLVPLIVVSLLVTVGMVLSLVTLATMKGLTEPFWFTALAGHLPPWYVWVIAGLLIVNLCTVCYTIKTVAHPRRVQAKQPPGDPVQTKRSDPVVHPKADQRVTHGFSSLQEPRPDEKPVKPARFPRSLWLLFLGIFINRFGSFVGTFLVLYLLARGYTIAQAGIAAGVYGLGSMGASLAGGYLADTVGRRATIALSMFSSAIPVLILSQVSSLALMLPLAGLAGLTTGLYRPAASALLTDLVPSEQRVKAFAWYRFMLNLGFAVGPALAGFLASHAFTLLFVVDAASSLVFGLIALLFLPAGKGGSIEQQGHTSGDLTRPAPRDYRFLFFLAGSLAVALVYFQMDSTLPLQVLSFGFAKTTFGMLLSLNGVIVLLLELPLSRVTQRFPQRWMIVAGWVLTGLGFGLTAIASSIPLLALTVVFWTLGEILHHPASAAYVADLAPVHMRGRYSGAWEFTWSLAQTLGPVAGTVAFAWNAPVFWLACGALACLAAVPLLSRQRVVGAVVRSADAGRQHLLQRTRKDAGSLLQSEAYQQARVELVLMKIWSQVLSLPVERIQGHSDFFHCGGDSGSLEAMVAEIHQRLHISLDAAVCFDYPVLCRLAAHLVQRQKDIVLPPGEGSVAL